MSAFGRPRKCYNFRLHNPTQASVTEAVQRNNGQPVRPPLAVRRCSQQAELCHLCCSPRKKEECGRQSESRRSVQYEMSPWKRNTSEYRQQFRKQPGKGDVWTSEFTTCGRWGLAGKHGCCTGRLAALWTTPAPVTTDNMGLKTKHPE